MRKKEIFWALILALSLALPVFAAISKPSTADHSRFKELQQDFTSGPEVTKACLSCHNDAGKQFMGTIHWTWICPKCEDKNLGKAGESLNNFCISIPGNEPRCTSCHAGYGWEDSSFDFTKEENIDCLVCHEQSGTYEKYPSGAGHPVKEARVFPENSKLFEVPDWNLVAQSVALPTRDNCGVCHFYGGGGDGVKHGDLDSSLFKPSRDLDVHMASEGEDFSCTRCHTTIAHRIAGRCYQTPAVEEHKSLIEDDLASRITCIACHSESPHKDGKLDDHTDKVACQSCHIPSYARKLPTMTLWDWSKAGDLKEGKPYKKKGDLDKTTYDSKKGVFEWGRNLVPEYAWFNGVIRNTLVRDTIDPEKEVQVNFVDTRADEKGARIYPFKVHRGSQPYDAEYRTLIFPKLFGPEGSGAFWSDFNWERAASEGMAAAGLPFSGKLGFVETSYRYPITHMVAPKEDSLSCEECHVRDGGRLANISGVYMPGRDGRGLITSAGWFLSILSLVGVSLHALIRIFGGKRE